jgi:hypothetical protein
MAEKDDMKEKNENEETPDEESSTEEEEEVSEASEDETADDTSGDDEAGDASTEEASDADDSDEESATDEDDSDEDAGGADADRSDEDAEAARAPADEEDDVTPDEGDDEKASVDEDEDIVDEDLSAGVDVDVDDPEPEDDADGPIRGYAAFYEHPDHLLAAARHARESKYEDFDAYSPFPIHGMDEAMGLGRSWIPWVTFGAGLVGFLTANALQFGMMTFDWPMIIGGKPFAPWPSFVPVMFELTVLVAGVTTALVMLKAAGCFQKADIIDERITNDRFVLWISADDKEFEEGEVESFLSGLNPLEIKRVHQ